MNMHEDRQRRSHVEAFNNFCMTPSISIVTPSICDL